MTVKSLKKDIRGAALIYVLVAIAIIVILGAATTTTAYMNLKATQIREQADNNFYNADAVMNSIVNGLETDISKAYEYAYAQTIVKMNAMDDMNAVKTMFNNEFKDKLQSLLNDEDGYVDGALYSPTVIAKYVQTVFPRNIKYTVSAANGKNYLDKHENGVTIKNLHVTYEEDSGYFDEIITDIEITIPQFDPEKVPDKTLDFNAFVFQKGMEVKPNNGININGNTYIHGGDYKEETNNSIALGTGSYAKITMPEEAVLAGNTTTEENSKFVIGTEGTDATKSVIYAENFNFGRYSDANLAGIIYVLDDLEVNGAYADVSLEGEYYGYSKSNKNASESSSININGANSKLDIEKLDYLVLAGSSYISATKHDSGNIGINNTDLQTGEAISVKSNQIAYLVDDKEFSQSNNASAYVVKNFTSNPMSYAQYEAMIKENGGKEATLNAIANKPLSYGNGKSYRDYGANVVAIFSNTNGGTVYFYLNFENASDASEYFRTVYRGNSLLSQRLRAYAAQYISNLKINPDSEILVNQNYIDQSISLYSSDKIFQDGLGYSQKHIPNEEAMNGILNKIKDNYFGDEANGHIGKKNEITFNSLINYDKMVEFISKATAAESYTDKNTENKVTPIENGVIMSGTTKDVAVIVDNDGITYNEDGSETYDESKDKPYVVSQPGRGLIVATGDVELQADWIGTIICGGRLYCSAGTKSLPINISVNGTVVRSVLPLYFSQMVGNVEESSCVMNIFIGYENVKPNNATDDNGNNADMIANCLSFSNWNRQ